MKNSNDFQSHEEQGGYLAHAYWQTLKSGGFNEAERRMMYVSHWETMLPAMKIDPEIQAEFMEKFNTRTASEARKKSVSGLLSVRNRREKIVIASCRKLSAAQGGVPRMDSPYCGFPPRIVPAILHNTVRAVLSSYLQECVEDGDWKSLDTLAKIIKRGDKPEDGRGGKLSDEGKTWKAFCTLHWNHRTLPTKKEIRDSMVLKEHNKGEFSKWINILGLGGIPAD